MDEFKPADWQGKSKYSVMASYLVMYIGFLGIVGSILYMLISNILM